MIFFLEYSRNETILKIGHLAKAITCVKWSVWVRKIQKNMLKPLYKNIGVVLYKKKKQKRTQKTQVFENYEAILRIGHLAKTVAFAWSLFVKN